VRLQLHPLAYNLATFLPCIELPTAKTDWSLTRLQFKLIKIGVGVVRHARIITFQRAELAVVGATVRAIRCRDPLIASAPVRCVNSMAVEMERKWQGQVCPP